MSIDYDGFQYVVRKKEKEKICFGSGCPRDTSRKGMSPFMKYYTLENYSNISPNSYNVLESFKAVKSKPAACSVSKKGYSGIARYGKKLVFGGKIPSPTDYEIPTFPRRIKRAKYPFDCTSKRETVSPNKNPGPGTYECLGRREMPFQHSFGGRAKLRLAVDLKCCARNADLCNVCREKPTGDYWHLNDKIFLCRPCMTDIKRKGIAYGKDELSRFRKVRDCSGIHSHEDTDAKIWLRHPKEVAKWARKEAYLSNYFRD